MIWKYFKSSFIFSFFGLAFCFFVGFYYTGQMSKAIEALVLASILAVLEISLSFDNAIVNAKILKTMDAVWRHRFITWGMLIAVFGMRLIFPLAIVSVVGSMSPWSALNMALFQPELYAETMLKSHLAVAAFGGSFLLLVALEFFYDANKDHHWIEILEKRLVKWGHIEALEIFITFSCIFILSYFVHPEEQLVFFKSSLSGVLIFIAVKALGQILQGADRSGQKLTRTGAASFIYLEILDSSFSFDGVVGAFAITSNLLIIMAGLSIGAFFVRSITILFVEKDVLNKFKYIEHGAFYAIGLLAILMLLDPIIHIPEWLTGLSGAIIILASFWWSLKSARIAQLKKML